MVSPHYPSANYNVEASGELPDIADSELLHMNDQDIEDAVLENMEVGPPKNVPEDMGRANYQPTIGAANSEIDQEVAEDHIRELIERRDELIRAKRERQKVIGVLKEDKSPPSKAA